MLNLKISLLITDDPDDHQAFSEALNEIATDWILLVVTDNHHAIRLLDAKKFIPDRIFIDLSMDDLQAKTLLNKIRSDDELKKTPVVMYDQDQENEIKSLVKNTGADLLSKDYSYQELKNFLKKELGVK